MLKPTGWQVEPEAYLGTDKGGFEYYLLKGDAFRTSRGYTSWVCTKAAWVSSKGISYIDEAKASLERRKHEQDKLQCDSGRG